MLLRLVFLPLLAFFLSIVAASDVKNLKKDEFESYLSSHELVLVKFFAPWCGHCKSLAPHFESAAKSLKSENNVKLAEVDCTVETEVCNTHGISGYPTLKVFRNGKFDHDYDDRRTSDAIVKHMIVRSRPASQEIKTLSDIDNILSLDRPTVVAYIKSDDFKAEFMKIASSLVGDAVFAHSLNPIFGSDNIDILRLYLPKRLSTKFEDEFTTYDKSIHPSSLREFIIQFGQGLLGYRTPDNTNFFPENNLVTIYGHSFDKYQSGVKHARNRLLKVIASNKDKFKGLRFAYSPADEYHMESSKFGYDYESEVHFVGILASDGKKYKFDLQNLSDFANNMDQYILGHMTSYLKSQPIATDDSTAVKHVVALNFDEIVNDPTKDVMIVFHSPNCGHCKNFLPNYEEAAQKLKNEPNVVLAAMDAVSNDVMKNYEITGYPTIYFVSKSNKENPVVYSSGRSADDVIKYVAAHATEELIDFDRSGNPKKKEL